MTQRPSRTNLTDLQLPPFNRLDLVETLERARRDQQYWLPSLSVRKQLATRSFVALMAPPQMGKSTVLDALQTLDQRFGRVPGFTTRPVEARDQHDVMVHFPHTFETVTDLLGGHVHGPLVQYNVFQTGYLYGTLLDDYNHEINVKEVATGAIKTFQSLGFKSMLKCGLVTDVALWRDRFTSVYPEGHPERTKRLAESRQSVSDLRTMDNVVLIENRAGHPELAAAEIRDIFDNHSQPVNRRQMLDELYDVIEELAA